MPSTGLSYLGPIRAVGKEVRDNHYALHWTALLQPTRIVFLSVEIQAWLKYKIKLHCVYFLLHEYFKSDKIDRNGMPIS